MRCPSCGEPSPVGARFCPACGQVLAPPRGDERRIVTVVFADLVGFTSVAELLDPEQVKNLVDDLFQRLGADVAAFGGRVDKVVGDALVALFGAPTAHEDDAERAVRAALRMQETMAALRASRGTPIQLRIGVNTGEVLTGALRAGGDYTAMGDVVNTAARLQAAAPPGGVAVGPATREATDGVIRYELIGDVVVKGREEVVRACLALDAVAPPGRRPRRHRSELVGRETELRLLLDGLRLSERHDRPLCAVVEGEAGVGKSRLLEAVVQAAADDLDALILEGRCVPYGAPSPWWPLATALMDGLRLPPEGDDRPGLVSRLTELGVPAEVADTAADGLLALLAEPGRLDAIDPVRARDELARSVVAIVEALARRSLVVLALADLQWAEPALLELLGRLLGRLAVFPLAVITTSRPGSEIPWPPAGGRHTTLLVRLDPLDTAAAGRLVDALLGEEVSADVRRELLDRAGGNPLFLEELSLLTGRSQQPGDLPGTLRGLVAARLDALAPAERAMLDNAAVLGPSGYWFALEEFAKALGQDSSRAALRALADADLLDVDGDRWSFRSELVREVAYATLTKADRARRHAGVAAARERYFANRLDRAEQVAFHYAVAAELVAELGPIERVPDDVADRAVHWLLLAATWNVERSFPSTAIRLASRGLALLGDAPSSDVRARDLLLVRARALALHRDVEAARADAEEAVVRSQAIGDRAGEARSRTAIGLAESSVGRATEADRHLAAAAELARLAGDADAEVDALRNRGMNAILVGSYDVADVHLGEAERLLADRGDAQAQGWVDQHRAWVAFVRGEVEEAELRLQRAATTFTAIGDHGGLAWVNGLLAFVRYMQGRREEAERLGLEVRAEAREHEERWAESMMTTLLAAIRLWSGRPGEAHALALDALRGFRELDDGYGLVQAAAPLARAEAAAGRADQAMRHMEEARAAAEPFGLRTFAATVAAGVAAHVGEGARAVTCAEDAMQDRDQPGPYLEALNAAALGRLQLGDVDRALLMAEEADAQGGAGPYTWAVLALALAAAGQTEGAMARAGAVLADSRSTYLDRILAGVAAGAAAARAGDRSAARAHLAAARSVADAAGDLPAGAFVRLVAAAAANRGSGGAEPDAADLAVDASLTLARLSNGGGGWPTAAAVVLGTPVTPGLP
jgi:class 3 adenylate cyclase/tetratricopeptide (TPR) repeat protein